METPPNEGQPTDTPRRPAAEPVPQADPGPWHVAGSSHPGHQPDPASPTVHHGPLPFHASLPPPPPPPYSNPWGYQPWWPQPHPEPARRVRTPRIAIAAIVMLALVSASIGAVIGSALGSRPIAQNQSLQQTVPTPASGSAPAGSAIGSPQSVADKVNPSVVNVTSHITGAGGQTGTAAGTGMVLTSGGLVLTNNHVIDGAVSVSVQVAGSGPSFSAKVLGYDRTQDVAVLQLANATGLHAITPGNSSKLSVGDPVIALGNALGKGGTPAVASGKITALDQTITATDAGGGNPETLNGLIETDAKIQPGDSGGPLVNAAGQVVGMDTAGSFSRRSGTSTGDGFAIAINSALTIAQQIESGQGSSTIQIGQRGIMGVGVADSTSPAGAVIKSVDPRSPADGAGLKAGDVITSINGKGVDSSSAVSAALTGKHAGDGVDVGWVDTSGQNHTATLQLIGGPPN